MINSILFALKVVEVIWYLILILLLLIIAFLLIKYIFLNIIDALEDINDRRKYEKREKEREIFLQTHKPMQKAPLW